MRHVKLGATLRRIREHYRADRANVAKALGMTSNFLGYLERDERNPSYDTLHWYGVLFGVPVGLICLLAETEESSKQFWPVVRDAQSKLEEFFATEHQGEPLTLDMMRARFDAIVI